jgi:hypothetical protein
MGWLLGLKVKTFVKLLSFFVYVNFKVVLNLFQRRNSRRLQGLDTFREK